MRIFSGGGLLVSAAILVLTSAALGWPEQARASFPGENGGFVLTWGHSPLDVGTDELATVSSEATSFHIIAGCSYECHHRSGDWSPSGRRLVYVDECADCMNKLVTVAPNGRDRKVVYRAGGLAFLQSPVWSPDGRRIAFIVYRWSNTDYKSDIYVIDRDGTNLVRLTDTRRQSEDDLDWSSRNLLVFRSSRGRFRENRYELFTMRPNGQDRRRLTNNNVPDREPDWAPGGWRFTFVRGRDGEISIMDRQGKSASNIASGYSPTWAPDGTVIAFVSSTDNALHTVRPSGQDETVLGNPVSEGSVYELDWRPR